MSLRCRVEKQDYTQQLGAGSHFASNHSALWKHSIGAGIATGTHARTGCFITTIVLSPLGAGIVSPIYTRLAIRMSAIHSFDNKTVSIREHPQPSDFCWRGVLPLLNSYDKRGKLPSILARHKFKQLCLSIQMKLDSYHCRKWQTKLHASRASAPPATLLT